MEQKEYSKPLTSFNIPVNLKVSISGKKDFLEKLSRYCHEKSISQKEFLDRILWKGLRKAGIKNGEQLLKESGNYEMLSQSIKDSMYGFLGVRSLSKYTTEESEKEWKNEGFI